MHGTLGVSELECDQFCGASATAWYALLIASGAERKACIFLRKRQYEPYWPRYRGEVKLNRHRRAIRYRSVIPGYLFLPIKPAPHWALFEDEAWYRGVIRDSKCEPVQIPELGRQGIEQIREIESALNASPIAAADGVPFKIGQKVRLVRLELTGTVMRIDKRRRVCVEAKLFGRDTRIMVAALEIEPI